MNKFFLCCVIYWCLFFILWVQVGVVIGGICFIYYVGVLVLSVLVSNYLEVFWLIDMYILSGGCWSGIKNEGNIMFFVVMLLLFMFLVCQENLMWVVYIGVLLFVDRESLFILSIVVIFFGKLEVNCV